MLETVDDLEHHFPLVGRYLLRVSRVGHRLVLVVLQADVPQLGVGHILDVNPLDFELALELVLYPNTAPGVTIVHRT